MKTNELRIGNWIKYEDKLVQVVQLSSLMILCQRDENQFLVNCTPKVFQPIELTEEVLVKIGFVKVHKKNIVGFNNVNEFILKNDINDNEFVNISYHLFESGNSIINIEQGDYYSGIDDNYIYKLNIKYLHELQNIYYCLTGEELEVSL